MIRVLIVQARQEAVDVLKDFPYLPGQVYDPDNNAWMAYQFLAINLAAQEITLDQEKFLSHSKDIVGYFEVTFGE